LAVVTLKILIRSFRLMIVCPVLLNGEPVFAIMLYKYRYRYFRHWSLTTATATARDSSSSSSMLGIPSVIVQSARWTHKEGHYRL